MKNSFLISLTVLFFYSCANIAPPTGGNKDTTIPKITSQSTENKTTNFKNKEIEFVFDEKIQVNNTLINLIPNTLKKPIIVKYHKKKCKIEFPEPLRENTTYKIVLDNAIGDLNENNKIEKLSLTFSTGNIIDSLKINGSVKYLLTNKNLDNIKIQLLDSIGENEIAFTKSNKDGSYEIDNIKNGTYKIIAYDDKNNNKKYDNNENIDFIKENLILNKNYSNINFFISPTYNEKVKIINKSYKDNTIEILLNKGVKKYSIQNTNLISKINSSNKLITIYNNKDIKDSIITFIDLIDSLSSITKDTLRLKFDLKKKSKKETLTLNPSNNIFYKNFDSLYLSLPKPLIDITKLNISINNKLLKNNTDYKQKNNSEIAIYTNNFNNDDSLIININAEKCMTIMNDSINNLNYKYIISKEANEGNLRGKINTNCKNSVIQLLNENYQIIKTKKTNSNSFEFLGIKPGKYNIRILEDKNNNGIWDSANYETKVKAEKLYYYKETLNVKENWEINDVDISCE